MADDNDAPQVGYLPSARLPDFKHLFVNHLRMKVNPTEFTLYMGVIDEIAPNVMAGLESVAVIMTPTTMKSLSEVLTQTIKVFEEQHGEIKQPLLKPLDHKKMNDIMEQQREKIMRGQN